jgi:D-glycero-alpha-D-manno-heptose-7-phosphate kinase
MIISRTPYRVSFVGGGSDLPAFCERQTGAVLSVTIDKAVYLTLHPYFDRGKTLLRYSKTELLRDGEPPQHPIFREALMLANVRGGVEISSSADVPSGTGLGSSSSFAVGLLHVLAAYRGLYASKEYLGATAAHLEIDLLGEPIGRQDQYAAAYGGLNLIEFEAGGSVRVEPITVSNDIISSLEQRLLMFYTGEQRQAKSVLSDQSHQVASNQEKFDVTAKMVELVYEMRDALFAGDLSSIGRLLRRNWELKRGLSVNISSSHIDDTYERALNAGAEGGKLLGAGGGGFLLLYCEPEKQGALREALADLNELDFRFDRQGSRIIYTDGSSTDNHRGLIRSVQDRPGLGPDSPDGLV